MCTRFAPITIMMKMSFIIPVVLLAAMLVVAQETPAAQEKTEAKEIYVKEEKPEAPIVNPVTSTVRQLVERQSKNIVAAAEEMPAEKYDFHPTEAQMTFAHLIFHIVGSNNFLCAKISDQTEPKAEVIDKDTKAKLVKALKASFDYCSAALDKTDDSKLGATVTLSTGPTAPRPAALIGLTHALADHYSKAAEAYAGLSRCFLKEGHVQEANEVAMHRTIRAPDSQAAHVALGEVYFRQGKMHDAEQEFLRVVNSVAPEPRAYLGLARVSAAISMYARAKQMVEKAHELDSNDPEIEWRWLNTLGRPARIRALEAYLANANHEDAELLEDYKVYLESLKQAEKQPDRYAKLGSTPRRIKTYLC